MLKTIFAARSIQLYTALFCMIVCIDRISKWCIIKALALGDINLFPGLNLSFSINHGVSLSLFTTTTPQGQYLLIGFVFLVFMLFLGYSALQYRLKIGLIPETFIIGGAAGNLLDRFFYGGVIDFLDIYIVDWHWYTFNVADCAIVLGVILIFIRSLYDTKN